MGLTPGHLSRVMRQDATRAVRPEGWTYITYEQQATAVSELQRLGNEVNEEQKCHQPYESTPEGPEAPEDLRAVQRIKSPSSWLKIGS